MKKENNKNWKNKQKPSDKFWKECLMKVLHSLENEELTWYSDNWHNYGISNSDKKKIEQEYNRFIGTKEKKAAFEQLVNDSMKNVLSNMGNKKGMILYGR